MENMHLSAYETSSQSYETSMSKFTKSLFYFITVHHFPVLFKNSFLFIETKFLL